MLDPMQIGINGASQVTVGATVDAIAAHAAQAEADGFPSYWVNQALVPDALTLLAAVGQATESIELGTAVINTWTRHPLMLAAQALTADWVGAR
jgi:alkanesulfonate monooxygenase SsuD/methylene tetrahydromethanopterin reductase-like flavin-dependent oxidoreductase (luciferase family)